MSAYATINEAYGKDFNKKRKKKKKEKNNQHVIIMLKGIQNLKIKKMQNLLI